MKNACAAPRTIHTIGHYSTRWVLHPKQENILTSFTTSGNDVLNLKGLTKHGRQERRSRFAALPSIFLMDTTEPMKAKRGGLPLIIYFVARWRNTCLKQLESDIRNIQEDRAETKDINFH